LPTQKSILKFFLIKEQNYKAINKNINKNINKRINKNRTKN